MPTAPLLLSPSYAPSLLTQGSQANGKGSLRGNTGYSNEELCGAICLRGGEDMRIARERMRGEALLCVQT